MKWFVETLTHVNERYEVEADDAKAAGEAATQLALKNARKHYQNAEIALVEPILWTTNPESGHTALLPR
jgi:hypothetical protein